MRNAPQCRSFGTCSGIWAVLDVGRYGELFDASIADPEAFWADAARDVSWIREPRRILDDSNPPFYRWFPDAELNTCANALDRHVADGRADQPALIYDSPVTGSQRTYTYAELLDETARFAGVLARPGRGQGRPGRGVHADDSRGRHHHAGVRADRRGALGGVRRFRRRTNWPPASTTPGPRSSCRPPAGSSPPARWSTSRCSTPRWTPRAPTPRLHHRPTRSAALRADRGPRPGLARPDGHRGARRSRCRSRPPTRSTCSTPRARPGSRRASSATTAATRWRCCGACATSTTSRPGEVFWAASDVGLGGRPLLHRLRRRCCSARRRCSTRANRSARPIPARSGGWPPSIGVKALFTAPTAIRAIRKEDPDGDVPGRVRPVRAAVPVPGRGAAGPRHLPLGVGEAGHPGHRPLVADRDGVGDRRQSDGGRAAADQARFADACPCPATTCASCTPTATACEPGEEGVDLPQTAVAARHVADAVGRRRPLRGVLPVASTPVTTSPATAATSTRTGTCS